MTVYDYQSGNACTGTPDAELVEESLACDTGAVNAVRADDGTWTFVRADDVADAERRGERVRTVYCAD